MTVPSSAAAASPSREAIAQALVRALSAYSPGTLR